MIKELADGAARCSTVLADRFFTPTQIKSILPKLDPNYHESPHLLAQTIDYWNKFMSSRLDGFSGSYIPEETIPAVAVPPKKSPLNKYKITMNTIFTVEPNLLNMDPDKIAYRKERIDSLRIINNMHELWTVLFNAPRGFFLQEYRDFVKKCYYVDQKVIPFIHDKKELQNMLMHPLVRSAAVTELDFDQIRSRYLFAYRAGYGTINFEHEVKSFLDKPGIRELLLDSNEKFLQNFAPCCTIEEYNSFCNLMKNYDLDEDDAEIYEEMAKLNDLNVKTFNKK